MALDLTGAHRTPLDQEMEVRTADAAVADLEQHLAAAGLGCRSFLDRQVTQSHEDGGGHRRSHFGHMSEASREADTSVNCARLPFSQVAAGGTAMSADVVIRGGTVVDGTGGASRAADV